MDFNQLRQDAATYAGNFPEDNRARVTRDELVGKPIIITDVETLESKERPGTHYVCVGAVIEDGSVITFTDGGCAIGPDLKDATLPLYVKHGLQLSKNGQTWRLAA